jgi:hypothetical protein
VGAVAACKLFLDRVEALRSGTDPARAASREQDQQAVALLEQRKLISESIESQLRGLIDQAKQLELAPVEMDGARELELQETVQRFSAWLADWRTTAATAITRRDDLISRGLASRRSTSNGEEDYDEAEEEPAVVTPAQPAGAPEF